MHHQFQAAIYGKRRTVAKFQKKPTGKITDAGEEYRKSRGLSRNEVRGLTEGDVAGLEIIEDNTEKVIEAIGTAIVRALEAIGIEAEGDAKGLCPVDTGRLRNSITHTIDGGDSKAVIGTNVEYARYVHNGTSRSKAQPFLTDAATRNTGKYRRIAEKMLENG